MRHCIWLKSLMSSCDHNAFYLLHEFLSWLINKRLSKLHQHKLSGHIVGMDKVCIIKTVISQYIDDQFISGKIIQLFVFVNEMMNSLDQPRLAPVIIYYPIADMSYGTNSKNYIEAWIKLKQLFKRLIKVGNYFFDGHQMFVKPL